MSEDRRKGPKDRRALERFKAALQGSITYHADNGGRRRDFKTREWFKTAAADSTNHSEYMRSNATEYRSYMFGIAEGMRVALRREKGTE